MECEKISPIYERKRNGLSIAGMFLMANLICLSAITYAAAGLVPVRFIGGSQYEGRLEVYYNGSWGTVCDDGMKDVNCRVVCSQLGYGGGMVVLDAYKKYGVGQKEIWLDEVTCTGNEKVFGDCMHNHWGDHDCQHGEDTGCKCDPPGGSVILPPSGSCDSKRHYIRAFDPNYPGIGRVEVQNSTGVWQVVCDDFWDDIDAAVFCRCLGYNDPQHFRAYWSNDLVDMSPALSMAYSDVQCTVSDMNRIQNIWDCPTKPCNGRCDPKKEAAAVACQAIPAVKPPAPPTAHLDCDGEKFQVCYTSKECTLKPEFLALDPACPYASEFLIEDGVCVNIPMDKCRPPVNQADKSSMNYCYDVLYTEHEAHNSLIIGNSWVRSACCSLAKNGTVLSSFVPHVNRDDKAAIANTQPNFTVSCYYDDTFSNELTFPVNISRGQDVYCKVMAHAWDQHLSLVVPNCRFMARVTGSPSFTFIEDKCPTSQELSINYYSFDVHSWGFKFLVPQFEGYDELFVSCDCYLCDPVADPKPYCDRTCNSMSGRTRRHAFPLGARPSLEVAGGPFHVQDSSYGPLFDRNGKLINQFDAPSPVKLKYKYQANIHDQEWMELHSSPRLSRTQRQQANTFIVLTTAVVLLLRTGI